MKVVYNSCYGGFGLSEEAIRLGRKLSGNPLWGGACLVGDVCKGGAVINRFYGGGDRSMDRGDPVLVEVVEKLGAAANDDCSKLKVDDVPPGCAYRINDIDGNESVEVMHLDGWRIAQ